MATYNIATIDKADDNLTITADTKPEYLLKDDSKNPIPDDWNKLGNQGTIQIDGQEYNFQYYETSDYPVAKLANTADDTLEFYQATTANANKFENKDKTEMAKDQLNVLKDLVGKCIAADNKDDADENLSNALENMHGLSPDLHVEILAGDKLKAEINQSDMTTNENIIKYSKYSQVRHLIRTGFSSDMYLNDYKPTTIWFLLYTGDLLVSCMCYFQMNQTKNFQSLVTRKDRDLEEGSKISYRANGFNYLLSTYAINYLMQTDHPTTPGTKMCPVDGHILIQYHAHDKHLLNVYNRTGFQLADINNLDLEVTNDGTPIDMIYDCPPLDYQLGQVPTLNGQTKKVYNLQLSKNLIEWTKERDNTFNAKSKPFTAKDGKQYYYKHNEWWNKQSITNACHDYITLSEQAGKDNPVNQLKKAAVAAAGKFDGLAEVDQLKYYQEAKNKATQTGFPQALFLGTNDDVDISEIYTFYNDIINRGGIPAYTDQLPMFFDSDRNPLYLTKVEYNIGKIKSKTDVDGLCDTIYNDLGFYIKGHDETVIMSHHTSRTILIDLYDCIIKIKPDSYADEDAAKGTLTIEEYLKRLTNAADDDGIDASKEAIKTLIVKKILALNDNPETAINMLIKSVKLKAAKQYYITKTTLHHKLKLQIPADPTKPTDVTKKNENISCYDRIILIRNFFYTYKYILRKFIKQSYKDTNYNAEEDKILAKINAIFSMSSYPHCYYATSNSDQLDGTDPDKSVKIHKQLLNVNNELANDEIISGVGLYHLFNHNYYSMLTGYIHEYGHFFQSLQYKGVYEKLFKKIHNLPKSLGNTDNIHHIEMQGAAATTKILEILSDLVGFTAFSILMNESEYNDAEKFEKFQQSIAWLTLNGGGDPQHPSSDYRLKVLMHIPEIADILVGAGLMKKVPV